MVDDEASCLCGIHQRGGERCARAMMGADGSDYGMEASLNGSCGGVPRDFSRSDSERELPERVLSW